MAVTYAQVRDWVLELPGGSEVMVEQWGHPTFRVNGTMFAAGGPDSPTMSVKASREEQAELVAGEPQTYAPAPYTGRFGWVQVTLATADPREVRDLIVQAWRRTATKKLLAQYDSSTA